MSVNSNNSRFIALHVFAFFFFFSLHRPRLTTNKAAAVMLNLLLSRLLKFETHRHAHTHARMHRHNMQPLFFLTKYCSHFHKYRQIKNKNKNKIKTSNKLTIYITWVFNQEGQSPKNKALDFCSKRYVLESQQIIDGVKSTDFKRQAPFPIMFIK